jgi:hypothetical protein
MLVNFMTIWSILLPFRIFYGHSNLKVPVLKKYFLRPGGVAQRPSHPPQEQKTRVRIPPGYKVFKEKHSNAVVQN